LSPLPPLLIGLDLVDGMQDLKAMVNAAGNRPVIIVNPRLKDVPGSGGVMQVNFFLPYTYIAAAYHLD
jgi:hypothetical protein